MLMRKDRSLDSFFIPSMLIQEKLDLSIFSYLIDSDTRKVDLLDIHHLITFNVGDLIRIFLLYLRDSDIRRLDPYVYSLHSISGDLKKLDPSIFLHNSRECTTFWLDPFNLWKLVRCICRNIHDNVLQSIKR